MHDIQIIIMAGGVGSRFWPMSTPDYPKQFIDVMGVGRSLIQLTVDRLKPICPVENMWVVTNEKYIRIVKEQIPDMPVDNILAEPEARNTAPCIAYACWKIQKKHPDAILLFRCGDFYETYKDDAVKASKILGITLTKSNGRKDDEGKPLAMAGFPYHALDTYLPKLIRAGERVAICDQLEMPKQTTSSKRGITEMVSPGKETGKQMAHNNLCILKKSA